MDVNFPKVFIRNQWPSLVIFCHSSGAHLSINLQRPSMFHGISSMTLASICAIFCSSITFFWCLGGLSHLSGYSGSVVNVDVSVVLDSDISNVKSIQSVHASCVDVGVLTKCESSISLSDCSKFRWGAISGYLCVFSSICFSPWPVSFHILSSSSIPKSKRKSCTSDKSSSLKLSVKQSLLLSFSLSTPKSLIVGLDFPVFFFGETLLTIAL